MGLVVKGVEEGVMKRHGGVSRFREAAPPAAFPGIARQRRKAGLHPFMFAITAHSRLGGRNAVEDGAAVAKPIGAGRRTEAQRGGQEWVSRCRSRWAPDP